MTPPPGALAARPAHAPRSAPPRPSTAPRPARPPRRVSGPARPVPRAGAVAAPRSAPPGQVALGAVGSLLEHPLLDRLLRGRLWIALVSFALLGIVAMQLYNLQLNSGVGRAIEHEALLQRENAALSIANSGLTSGTRVESQAGAMGMGVVAPGSVQFLTLHRSQDLREALRALHSGGPSASAAASEPSEETVEVDPEPAEATLAATSETEVPAEVSSEEGAAVAGGEVETETETVPTGTETAGTEETTEVSTYPSEVAVSTEATGGVQG